MAHFASRRLEGGSTKFLRPIVASHRETPSFRIEAVGWSRRGERLANAERTRGVDLVLSSGFLAFAKHAGFLKAVHEVELNVNGVMGTSSGAYAGSLYCAGYRPEDIAKELCHIPPIHLLKPNWFFWNGFLLLDGVVERLRDVLPATFESLDKRLAVGVVNIKGEHQIIDSGPLPEAIAASGAIPFMFAPVNIPGNHLGPFKDGGVKDRTGLNIWRQRNCDVNALPLEATPPALVHLISRSFLSGSEDAVGPDAKRVFVLRSRKSKQNLFSLGDYQRDMLETYENVIPSIEKVQERLKRKVTA